MLEHQYVTDYLQFCQVECRFSEQSLMAYRQDLTQFFSLCGSVTSFQEGCLLFLKQLRRSGYKDRSVQRKLSVLRGFWAFLVQEGHCQEKDLFQVKTRRFEQVLPAILDVEQIELILAQPDDRTFLGVTHLVMMECLYSLGLRVSECICLRVENIDFEGNVVTVMGKGSKQRVVPLTGKCRQLLRRYLALRESFSLSSVSSLLFVNKSGGGYSRQGVFLVVKRYAGLAGLSLDRCSPHAFRHAFASHLVEGGARLRDVQLLLGHSQLATTQIYTRVSASYLKDAYLQAHPRASA